MLVLTPAIILSVRAHGEHGAVVRALTPADGLQAGYVRGGRSRRLRPILVPGNIVQAELRARTEDQLAALTVELVQSRAPLLAEPLPAAAIDWACALTAASLPEGHPYPRLHAALDGLLAAIEAAPSARLWAAALLRFELLLVAELGFAVEQEVAGDDWAGLFDGLRVTRRQLAAHILTGKRAEVLAARDRLVDRLERAAS